MLSAYVLLHVHDALFVNEIVVKTAASAPSKTIVDTKWKKIGGGESHSVRGCVHCEITGNPFFRHTAPCGSLAERSAPTGREK